MNVLGGMAEGASAHALAGASLWGVPSPFFWTAAVLLALGGVVVPRLLAFRRATPSAHRNWATDHARAPAFVSLGETRWRIEDVRDFIWTGPTSGTPRWENREVDLVDLKTAWLVVTPFRTRWRGLAHTFVTFEFETDRASAPTDRASARSDSASATTATPPTAPPASTFLAISVEARRQVGERYSFLKGALRHFELLYVAADEADMLHLRALHRQDEVHLYPLALDPETLRKLFRSYAEGANTLRSNPAFYHTILDNCTTRILDHLDAVRPVRVPRGYETFFPGHVDALFLRVGLLAQQGSIETIRHESRVNDRAAALRNADDFSLAIRGRLR